jgi:hypothetical protein
MNAKSVTIDFVAADPVRNEWKMVLVETGPWAGITDFHLRALQSRLYDCIDAALDGQLAERFPESRGKHVVVQVDCYNIARDVVDPFFEEFSNRVFTTGDYKDATVKNRYVLSISFALTFDSIH